MDKKSALQDLSIWRPSDTDRVLDLLENVKGYKDGTLSFRRSCAHGICGSDAMRINGLQPAGLQDPGPRRGRQDHRRADPGPEGDQGPDRGHGAVLRQLQEDPALTSSTRPLPADGKERLQSPEQRERFDDTTKCILCACCTTSCPSFWGSDDYLGPAALVTAHRFIFDSRDEAAAERLQIVSRDQRAGALPHRLQLHPGLPARDPGDRGHRRTEARGDDRKSGLRKQSQNIPKT